MTESKRRLENGSCLGKELSFEQRERVAEQVVEEAGRTKQEFEENPAEYWTNFTRVVEEARKSHESGSLLPEQAQQALAYLLPLVEKVWEGDFILANEAVQGVWAMGVERVHAEIRTGEGKSSFAIPTSALLSFFLTGETSLCVTPYPDKISEDMKLAQKMVAYIKKEAGEHQSVLWGPGYEGRVDILNEEEEVSEPPFGEVAWIISTLGLDSSLKSSLSVALNNQQRAWKEVQERERKEGQEKESKEKRAPIVYADDREAVFQWLRGESSGYGLMIVDEGDLVYHHSPNPYHLQERLELKSGDLEAYFSSWLIASLTKNFVDDHSELIKPDEEGFLVIVKEDEFWEKWSEFWEEPFEEETDLWQMLKPEQQVAVASWMEQTLESFSTQLPLLRPGLKEVINRLSEDSLGEVMGEKLEGLMTKAKERLREWGEEDLRQGKEGIGEGVGEKIAEGIQWWLVGEELRARGSEIGVNYQYREGEKLAPREPQTGTLLPTHQFRKDWQEMVLQVGVNQFFPISPALDSSATTFRLFTQQAFKEKGVDWLLVSGTLTTDNLPQRLGRSVAEVPRWLHQEVPIPPQPEILPTGADFLAKIKQMIDQADETPILIGLESDEEAAWIYDQLVELGIGPERLGLITAKSFQGEVVEGFVRAGRKNRITIAAGKASRTVDIKTETTHPLVAIWAGVPPSETALVQFFSRIRAKKGKEVSWNDQVFWLAYQKGGKRPLVADPRIKAAGFWQKKVGPREIKIAMGRAQERKDHLLILQDIAATVRNAAQRVDGKIWEKVGKNPERWLGELAGRFPPVYLRDHLLPKLASLQKELVTLIDRQALDQFSSEVEEQMGLFLATYPGDSFVRPFDRGISQFLIWFEKERPLGVQLVDHLLRTQLWLDHPGVASQRAVVLRSKDQVHVLEIERDEKGHDQIRKATVFPFPGEEYPFEIKRRINPGVTVEIRKA